MRITDYAVSCYREQVERVDAAKARACIARAERAVDQAAGFGCQVVVLG